MVRRIGFEPTLMRGGDTAPPRPVGRRSVSDQFVDVVGRGGSAYLALNRLGIDPYTLGVALEKLPKDNRDRACRDLLRSDNPLVIERAFNSLPSQAAIEEISSLLLDGKEVHWQARKLLAQAPGLTREQIMRILPRSAKPKDEQQILEEVAGALGREDGEVRNLDGRRFNSPRVRELVERHFPEVSPGGNHMLIVSPHDLGSRQHMLRQFLDLLVARMVEDRMVKPEELESLLRDGGEVGKLIVARHPEATAEQLGQLVCEVADYIHIPAYLNAVQRGLYSAIALPSAAKWIHRSLMDDPATPPDELHRLEKTWAEPLFRLLEKKLDEVPVEDRSDLLMLMFELRTWLYPDLSVLINICRKYGVTVSTNTMYYKLTQRLYPGMQTGYTPEELIEILEQEINERHLPM